MAIETLETRRLMAQVQSLVLVNADTDQDIGELTDGATINVSPLRTRNLNVRVVVSDDTESVRVRLDGRDHSENTAPFTWAGDDGKGDYYAWQPADGAHEFVLTAYTQDNAKGTASAPVTIRFQVIDQFVPGPKPIPTADTTPPPAAGNWSLGFADEFNDNSLDGWHTNIWWSTTRGIGAEQTSPANVSVSGGSLNLTATKSGAKYTSGLVTSEDLHEFQYGYVETRMKLPPGVGFWPAFWMLPANHNDGLGEIDAMEWVGNDPNSLHVSYHVDGRAEDVESENLGSDLSAASHTFGVNWQQDAITWYVDGRVFHQTANYTHTPMYVILNLAVGGPWAGKPTATTPFPSTLKVDYLRVWELVPEPPPQTEPTMALARIASHPPARPSPLVEVVDVGPRERDEIVGDLA